MLAGPNSTTVATSGSRRGPGPTRRPTRGPSRRSAGSRRPARSRARSRRRGGTASGTGRPAATEPVPDRQTGQDDADQSTQTNSDVPKNGATTRLAAISSPSSTAPARNTAAPIDRQYDVRCPLASSETVHADPGPAARWIGEPRRAQGLPGQPIVERGFTGIAGAGGEHAVGDGAGDEHPADPAGAQRCRRRRSGSRALPAREARAARRVGRRAETSTTPPQSDP